MKLNLVFVHGWSVTNTSTYGELPLRLKAEGERAGLSIDVTEIYLGKYISFHDEVRLKDISRAFQSAVESQLAALLARHERFVAITHSTGGPVIRDWWHRYFPNATDNCPMSHLIMLAPANYGSALAQLGKARVGRLMSWLDRVEPGQGVLDWLELGSVESWVLNKEWITSDGSRISATNVFPFVLTGQSIDRKLYDNLNTYTGEMGTDGVVRVAAANLQGRYIRLEQPAPIKNPDGKWVAGEFRIAQYSEAPATPLRVLAGKSHSGEKMGVMASVKKAVPESGTNDNSSETIQAILDCIRVSTLNEYNALVEKFRAETAAVQAAEQIELEDRILLHDRHFIHDRYSMVIFKVVDSEGYPVKDYDLLITAGEADDPNHLPNGFFMDKQRNRISGDVITYYFNHDVLHGTPPIPANGSIRGAITGIDQIGLDVRPRPDFGFVHYLPGKIKAGADLFNQALAPNSTTLIEIVLQRLVHNDVFQLTPLTGNSMPNEAAGSFKETKPTGDIL